MLNTTRRDYVDYKLYAVTKLKDKYGFRIKLFFSDGTEETKQIGGFLKKTDANKERNKVAAELINHTFVIEKKIKFEEYIRYWFYEVMKPKIVYNTYMSYRNVVENYAIPFFGRLNLIQINSSHIQKFYNDVAQKYISVARLAKTVMETAMDYARVNNLISVDPTIGISLPKDIEEKPYKTLVINEEKVFNIEQIKILIEASKNTPIHMQILFAVLMGLRKQEINAIKYSDIDFINRKLYLKVQLGRKTEDNKESCTKKMLTKQEVKLKTPNSERILDIPDMVFEAILEERKKYEANKRRRINDKTTPFTDYNYVCCSTYGRPRSKGFHNRYYNALLKENDLPKIGFHDLRHTYATLLLINNYDLKAVSQLLGHASTIITSNVYFDKNRVIIDCLDELNLYIDKVKPVNDNKENNSSIDENLDTNLMINKFI